MQDADADGDDEDDDDEPDDFMIMPEGTSELLVKLCAESSCSSCIIISVLASNIQEIHPNCMLSCDWNIV